MPTEVLTIGPVHSITQDTVYALPARAVRMRADAAVEISIDGTNFIAVTASTTGTDVAGGFVRCTSGDTDLILRAF